MSARVLLLLLALLAPASPAQDGSFLPDGLPAAPGAAQAGIEATGDTAEVRALTDWANEHRHRDPEQAQLAAERALALARDLDDQRGLGAGLRILGNIIVSSDPYQAERYYAEALEASEQIGDERGRSRVQSSMGNVYERRGDLEQALTAYFDALEGFERLGDTEGQAGVLTNIGIVYRQQGSPAQARPYYERAVELAETLDEPILLAHSLNNLAILLMEQGAYEAAETHFRRALAIYEEQGAQHYAVSTTNNLGDLFNTQGRHEQALSFLLPAARRSEELGIDEVQMDANLQLGKAYLGLGEYDRALHHANESLALAEEAESVSYQMEGHQTLSEIHAAAGNYEEAYRHQQAYATARDSVFNTERTEIITEMQTRYETEEKQRANERLQQENQIQALQLILLLGGVGGLLLILGVLFYRYRLKQKANRLLEDLDKAKSRFFANISHEFRTPLTVILGGLQDGLAGRFGALSEKLTNRDQAMLRNSRQLQRLIDEVLDLGRLEAGKLELNLAPGDLVRSVKRIVEADAPLAERNGITLTFEHNDEHCPRLYDPEKLEKIVGNLLSNALKFTPKGGAVRVELHGDDPIEIAVSDTGPGIPVEAQAKVFERFEQIRPGPAEAGHGSQHGGTGIGLALAKELAELHGGTITVESEPGKGSAFTVRLPLEQVALDDVVASTGLPRRSSTEPGRSTLQEGKPVPEEPFEFGGDGLPDATASQAGVATPQQRETESDRTTVLIIEDNADVRAFVRRSLEEVYRVLEAADGETGLQQAREALPDLIVSDIMLPGIDGYEVARRLKAESTTECIPVVMLTARAAEEDQTEGYGSGAEVYITKPFSPETLQAAVARLLEERLRLRWRLQENAKRDGERVAGNGHPTLTDRARAVVLEHLHDEDFGVEELAAALGMSRPTLYRRVKKELGLTAADFVRTLRLDHAHELLAGGAGSVSEVAYAVGFKSLSHFTRSFREHHGKAPSSILGAAEK